MGLDPGFGSSAFGIVVTEYVDQCINVKYADEFPKPDFNQMIETAAELVDRFGMSYENNSRIFVDAANPSFIRALKDRLDDNPEYERQIDHLRTNWGKEVTYNLQLIQAGMFIVPVPFAKEHKHMLAKSCLCSIPLLHVASFVKNYEILLMYLFLASVSA
jgi:hypothetical protein